ncbi:hypothetical protein F5J12DRAFT_716688, partial [Pisolithus orientalis]|uniref:uncharacterized protein n=1 Tax=Pisolithus orientalis TaxID=936130 RepID=UPI002224E0E4
IVIDEAMGTFANVDVFLYADTIVTSLSEYFDGHATALGGCERLFVTEIAVPYLSYSPLLSLVINPQMQHHLLGKRYLKSVIEDTYVGNICNSSDI